MKRKDTLLRAMSEIRPQYIEDANAFAETEKHESSFRIWRTGVRIAVAACAAVAVFVFYPRGENEVTVTQTSTAENEIVSTQKTDTVSVSPDEYANTGTDMNAPEITGTYPIDRAQETGISEINHEQATVTASAAQNQEPNINTGIYVAEQTNTSGPAVSGTTTGITTASPNKTDANEYTTTVATLPPFSFSSGSKLLTREDIVVLSQKKNKLTWGDLASYQGTRYSENVCEYLTDDGCRLLVSGGAENPTASTKPESISLVIYDTVTTNVIASFEDIRIIDMETFFKDEEMQLYEKEMRVEILPERNVTDRNYQPPEMTYASFRGRTDDYRTPVWYGQGIRTENGEKYGYIEIEAELGSGSYDLGIKKMYLDYDDVLHIELLTYEPAWEDCMISERLIELHYAPGTVPELKGLEVIYDYGFRDSENPMFMFDTHKVFENNILSGIVRLERKDPELQTVPQTKQLSIPQGKDSLCWFDNWTEVTDTDISIDTMPYFRFHYEGGSIEVFSGNERIALAGALPILNAYFSDLNGDSYPELCVTGSYGSGIWDMHVEVYDVINRRHYALRYDDIEVYDYMLVSEDNEMRVLRGETYSNWMNEPVGVQVGTLTIDGDTLRITDTYLTYYFKPE